MEQSRILTLTEDEKKQIQKEMEEFNEENLKFIHELYFSEKYIELEKFLNNELNRLISLVYAEKIFNNTYENIDIDKIEPFNISVRVM